MNQNKAGTETQVANMVGFDVEKKSMIYPFKAPCPKCGRPAGPAKRYEPEITEEAYQRADEAIRDDQKKSCPWRNVFIRPQEEHLVHECDCEFVFWTRTADYKPPESTP